MQTRGENVKKQKNFADIISGSSLKGHLPLVLYDWDGPRDTARPRGPLDVFELQGDCALEGGHYSVMFLRWREKRYFNFWGHLSTYIKFSATQPFPPPCTHFGPQYNTKATQPPLLRIHFGLPPHPSVHTYLMDAPFSKKHTGKRAILMHFQ